MAMTRAGNSANGAADDTMNLREERGAFWWHSESVAQGEPAPAYTVAGQLVIDERGRSRLELDGTLPSNTESSPKDVGFNPMPEGAAIAGIIKGKNQHVLLSGLHRSGINFSMMSHETFRAENCIIGDNPFPARNALSQFRSLEIDLKGFEEWLGLRSISFSGKRSSMTIKYKKPKDLVYPLDDGRLSVRYYVNRPFDWDRKTYELALSELAALHYGFFAPRTLKDIKAQYGLLEEWLILMTNSEHSLDWPEVTVRNKASRYKLYFYRERNTAAAPELYECYPLFAHVRDQLGQLFSAWKERRNKYGSAFVLYVASRRGFRLYTENRFINFIWAMESYHRTKYPPASVAQPAAGANKLDKKIQRILGQVTKSTDRKWLKDRLEHTEISLKERITQVIMALPLELEKEKCDKFGEECGQRRNDLSHYGGRRDNTKAYDNFHEDLYRKSQALFYLLHVLILQELGVAADILRHFVYQSAASYRVKVAFVGAGLLDKDVLKPPPIPTSTPLLPTAGDAAGPGGSGTASQAPSSSQEILP
jgi:hypothetical protein